MFFLLLHFFAVFALGVTFLPINKISVQKKPNYKIIKPRIDTGLAQVKRPEKRNLLQKKQPVAPELRKNIPSGRDSQKPRVVHPPRIKEEPVPENKQTRKRWNKAEVNEFVKETDKIRPRNHWGLPMDPSEFKRRNSLTYDVRTKQI